MAQFNKISSQEFFDTLESGSVQEVISVLNRGISINATDKYGRTPLCIVVERNNLELINLILREGADNSSIERALTIAAQKKPMKTISALIRTKNDASNAALTALKSGRSMSTINELLRLGADVNLLLRAALENGCSEAIVSALIKAGADVKTTDVLTAAISNLCNYSTVNMLIKAGAEVSKWALLAAIERNNALMVACLLKFGVKCDWAMDSAMERGCCQEIMTELFRAGFRFSYRHERDNEHGLIDAIERRYSPEIITAMIAAGFNVNSVRSTGYYEHHESFEWSALTEMKEHETWSVFVKTREDETPLSVALEKRRDPDIIGILLKAGARIKKGNSVNDDLISIIKGKYSAEIIILFIKSGVSVNLKDKDGKTPLIYAAEYSVYPEVIDALIDAGAEDIPDNDGKTALMYASEKNNHRVVEALLNAGAYPKARDRFGRTALYYAQNNALLKDMPVMKRLL